MNRIHLTSKLIEINGWTLLHLDDKSSSKLSTRGVAMIEGTINGFKFQTVLEPDGKNSHWFRLDNTLLKAINSKAGDIVTLDIEQSREWAEPKLPSKFKDELSKNAKVLKLWNEITPLARWEWTRWIGATKNEDTKNKRVLVAISKMSNGSRRPCCFNSRQCTVPYVSNNGILLDPIK